MNQTSRTLVRQAASDFHDCAARALEQSRQRAGLASVARRLGVDARWYSRVVQGEDGYGSLDTVVDWLYKWNQLGFPHLNLTISTKPLRASVFVRDEAAYVG